MTTPIDFYISFVNGYNIFNKEKLTNQLNVRIRSEDLKFRFLTIGNINFSFRRIEYIVYEQNDFNTMNEII